MELVEGEAEVRQRVDEPPRQDTWQLFPDAMDQGWKFADLPVRGGESGK